MIDLKYLKEWAWEREYLSDIFALIPDVKVVALHWRSERLFRRLLPRLRSKFVKERLVIPEEVDEETVVVILSDELYRFPKKMSAMAVFKQYVSQKDKTSIPFPLGFRDGFPSVVPHAMHNRTIDVGFIGRMYPHRKSFLTALSAHSRLKRFRIELTSEARLSLFQYADFLNSTKVSLCLPGNCSPETFRFYESAKAGCIVVSATMPANGLYESHPGIQVDDINDVNGVAEILQSMLEAPEGHAALQQRSLQTWESHYSPPAVAAMVRRVVESRAAGRYS